MDKLECEFGFAFGSRVRSRSMWSHGPLSLREGRGLQEGGGAFTGGGRGFYRRGAGLLQEVVLG